MKSEPIPSAAKGNDQAEGASGRPPHGYHSDAQYPFIAMAAGASPVPEMNAKKAFTGSRSQGFKAKPIR
jgi:hypothetical protein